MDVLGDAIFNDIFSTREHLPTRTNELYASVLFKIETDGGARDAAREVAMNGGAHTQTLIASIINTLGGDRTGLVATPYIGSSASNSTTMIGSNAPGVVFVGLYRGIEFDTYIPDAELLGFDTARAYVRVELYDENEEYLICTVLIVGMYGLGLRVARARGLPLELQQQSGAATVTVVSLNTDMFFKRFQ